MGAEDLLSVVIAARVGSAKLVLDGHIAIEKQFGGRVGGNVAVAVAVAVPVAGQRLADRG